MKKFTFPLFLVISLWVFVPVYADMPPAAPGREALALPKLDIVSCDSPSARSQCADGMCSTSTGSGTCSSHGGVVGSGSNSSGSESESTPYQSEPESQSHFTLAPAPSSDPPAPIEPAPVSPAQPTLNQPIPTQIPASGGILTSQSVPLRLTSAISVLLVMIAAAVRAVSKI